MAVDFPNSPSDGDTVTVGTKTYSYNASKGVWKDIAGDDLTPSTLSQYMQVANTTALTDQYLQVANSSSIGVTTYSALSDLPMSGQTTGKLAFVSGTNRLYIWNGTGWYNIALINTSPSISGVSSSYSLNTDGSNTVVTLVASDPEGLPISFTASHSGLGVGANAIATVTQSNNIFTFTPTTNTALFGTFTTTFTASDGVNIAGANSSFTLAFTVNNINYTTALITSVGANLADNNDFVDSSTNSHTITAAGNATQTTFSPYRHGGYSTYHDGAGDYLTISNEATITLGSGDFCVECWTYLNSRDNDRPGIWSNYGVGGFDVSALGLHAGHGNSTTTQYQVVGNYTGGSSFIINAGTILYKQWVHLAVVRNSGTIYLYVNGVQEGSASLSQNFSKDDMWIGVAGDNTAKGINGYVTDFRVVVGSPVYTSSFTPPTQRLTAITNTQLLTCHLPYIADGSTNGHSITVNGNTKTEPFAPYDYEPYSASTNGGSMYFDGTGDYLRADTALDGLTSTSDPWTLEAWVYPKRTPASAGGTVNDLVFGVNTASSGGNVIGLATGIIHLGSDINLNTKPQPNTWNHMAAVYDGSVLKIYLNGKLINTYTWTPSTAFADCVLGIGTEFDAANGGTPGNYFQGNISDVRVTESTVYTANFTPPASPLTVITNMSLLIRGTNSGIIDKSQTAKTLTLNGNVSSSTTQTKYLSSSMYFDGTGDYLTIADDVALQMDGDFTWEAWVYPISTPSASNYKTLWAQRSTNSGQGGPAVVIDSSGNYLLFISNAAGSAWSINGFSTGLSTTLNTWQHIALVKNGTTLTLYKNGVAGSSTTHSTAVGTSGSLSVMAGAANGAQAVDGYMSDFRITKGLARYTANFTPPTSSLQG